MFNPAARGLNGQNNNNNNSKSDWIKGDKGTSLALVQVYNARGQHRLSGSGFQWREVGRRRRL